MRELGTKAAACKQGCKYLVVNRDAVKSQAGFLCADDVCMMAGNEQDLQMIFDNISGCISNMVGKLVKSQRWFI